MEIFDLHNDGYDKDLKDKDKILISIWTTELLNPMQTIKQYRDKIKYLHIEDAHFLTPENIEEFIRLKPITVGLTWNYDNCLVQNGHFTKWGKEVVKKLEINDIQIDTAHLPRTAFYEFIKLTKNPLLCTHTAFYGIRRHKRNLTDKQIKIIIKSKGLIGLCLVPQFLTSKVDSCDEKDILKHYLYYKQFDPDLECFAFGTDFNGTKQLPSGIEDYDALSRFIRKYKIKTQDFNHRRNARKGMDNNSPHL
ncbi:MAG: membrane dipeptidase [Christensenellaceae bacterium]|jgi:microsomal dipeptidase-like Zn-dependent dipeptidase|nr:membrane dipeptidase [Christensenellaceae bacterium]